jgi:hypothetical protein
MVRGAGRLPPRHRRVSLSAQANTANVTSASKFRGPISGSPTCRRPASSQTNWQMVWSNAHDAVLPRLGFETADTRMGSTVRPIRFTHVNIPRSDIDCGARAVVEGPTSRRHASTGVRVEIDLDLLCRNPLRPATVNCTTFHRTDSRVGPTGTAGSSGTQTQSPSRSHDGWRIGSQEGGCCIEAGRQTGVGDRNASARRHEHASAGSSFEGAP